MRRGGELQAIRVLIVDDMPDTRASIRRLLELTEGFVVVAEAGDGREALSAAHAALPDCVLLDINMPVMDGIGAAEAISMQLPEVAVVMMSVQGEQEYLRKAMAAGARDYLVKPFSADELAAAVRGACKALRRQRGEQPREPIAEVLAVLGPKGGVGRTTVAANLALAFAAAGESTCLVDLNAQFGDLAMALDIVPKQNLAGLSEADPVDIASIEESLELHKSGVRLLAGPDRPEEAELVSVPLVEQVLRLLCTQCRRLVIDMPAQLGDLLLPVLDRNPKLLLITGPDLASVRNSSQAVRVLRGLKVEPEQIQVILNRAQPHGPVSLETIERNIGLSVSVSIPLDERAMNTAATRGEPVVAGQPGSPAGRALKQLADMLAGKSEAQSTAVGKKRVFAALREARLVNG